MGLFFKTNVSVLIQLLVSSIVICYSKGLYFFHFINYVSINSKELTIGGIFQFVMSKLRKKHHFKIDVDRECQVL
jgi:hypothetical protein